MKHILRKLLYTQSCVDDIEKAINEHGIPTKYFALEDYGNLIRSIVSEAKYPQYATLLLHRVVSLDTTAVNIINNDIIIGIFNSKHEWSTTENNNMFHFTNVPVLKPYSTVISYTDSNVLTGITAYLECSTLVELTEMTEQEEV